MTNIGYATLQIIPSLDGVSEAVNKQLDGKLRVAGKRGGAQLAKGVGEGLKDLEREVDSAGKAYQKLKDRADDALGKIRADEAALKKLRDSGASDDRIIKAEERLATSRRNSARASREANDGHNSLLAAQRALAAGSDHLGGKLSGLAGFADMAGGALASAGAVAAGAATLGIAALAAGAVVAGKALYDMGSQFDEISDNFVIKLGVTGTKLGELNKQVADLGPTMAIPLGQIADISVEVNRRLDGTTTQLESVTQAVGDLNRMTGTDTDIRKFGQLLAQWNIPAQDQVKTLDTLFNASRKTGASVNDLVETLTSKGATGLRELNIPLDSSVALFSKLQEGGLDASGAIDVLAKVQKAAAKDNKSMNDELTETINKVKGGDAQAGFAAFGKSAGPLIEALQNGKLTLKDFYSALEEGGPTIAETASLTSDFAEKWQKLKNRLEVAIQPVASAVFDQLNEKLGQVSDWAIAHQDDVIHIIGAIGTGLLEAGKDAITFAEGVLSAFKHIIEGYNDLPGFLRGDTIDTSFIDKAISGLDGVKGKLGGAQDWWKGFTDRAADAVKLTQSLGDNIRATLEEDGEIHLSADDADARAKLEQYGIAVKNVDGVVTITATTAEGQRIVDAWRAQQANDPANIPVQPKLDQRVLDQQKQMLIDAFKGTTVPISTGLVGGGGSFDIPPPGRRAAGGLVDPLGRISGPGSGTSDSILAAVMGGKGGFLRVSNEESINTAASTRANWPVIAAMNAGANLGAWFKSLPGLAGGGLVDGPDVLAAQSLSGTPYSKEQRFDCSGSVARVINTALGTGGGLMTTKTAREWLAARGFVEGTGGPGQISVGWYDRGPNPNDGHMAMTLSNGLNAEAGGKNGVFTIGGNAAGANDPQFDHHMYLPQMFGEGLGGSSGGSSWAAVGGGGGGSAAGVPGIGPNGESGYYTPPDAKTVSEADEKVRDADDRVKEAEARRRELEADAKESQKISADTAVQKATREAADARADRDEALKGKFTAGKASGGTGGGGSRFGVPGSLSGFGSAIGTFLDGQISSALGVLGVNDSPGWLQGLSQFVGGISVGGSDGGNIFGGAAPASAASRLPSAAPDLGDVHGAGGGRAPGPGVTFSPTFNTNDDTAFQQYRRWQNDQVGAKLGSL